MDVNILIVYKQTGTFTDIIGAEPPSRSKTKEASNSV